MGSRRDVFPVIQIRIRIWRGRYAVRDLCHPHLSLRFHSLHLLRDILREILDGNPRIIATLHVCFPPHVVETQGAVHIQHPLASDRIVQNLQSQVRSNRATSRLRSRNAASLSGSLYTCSDSEMLDRNRLSRVGRSCFRTCSGSSRSIPPSTVSTVLCETRGEL